MWQALSLVGAAKLLKDLGVPMTLAQLRDCDASAQSRIIHTLLARLSRSQLPLTDQRCAFGYAWQDIAAVPPEWTHASYKTQEICKLESTAGLALACAVSTLSCSWHVAVSREKCVAQVDRAVAPAARAAAERLLQVVPGGSAGRLLCGPAALRKVAAGAEVPGRDGLGRAGSRQGRDAGAGLRQGVLLLCHFPPVPRSCTGESSPAHGLVDFTIGDNHCMAVW